VTSSCSASLRLFIERQEAQKKKHRDAILVRLDQAAKRLANRFPTVNQVSVVGSFLIPQLFREDSDIDVVVHGLSKEDYFDAFFLLEQELQRPVDLLREEEIPEKLRQRLDSALTLYASERIRNSANPQE
jgi:predicted nucleotidyltransferase